MSDDSEIIKTELGPGHIIAGAKMADGSPAWLVMVRRTECAEWPYNGAFAFFTVPCVNTAPVIDREAAE